MPELRPRSLISALLSASGELGSDLDVGRRWRTRVGEAEADRLLGELLRLYRPFEHRTCLQEAEAALPPEPDAGAQGFGSDADGPAAKVPRLADGLRSTPVSSPNPALAAAVAKPCQATRAAFAGQQLTTALASPPLLPGGPPATGPEMSGLIGLPPLPPLGALPSGFEAPGLPALPAMHGCTLPGAGALDTRPIAAAPAPLAASLAHGAPQWQLLPGGFTAPALVQPAPLHLPLQPAPAPPLQPQLAAPKLGWSAWAETFTREFVVINTAIDQEEARARRSALRVEVQHDPKGEVLTPAPVLSFEEVGVFPLWTLEAAASGGWVAPRPLQAQALPIVLSGRDLVSIAPPNSGKTGTFLLPAIVHIEDQEPLSAASPGPIALFLVPSRERAVQVGEEVAKMLKTSWRSEGHSGGLRSAVFHGSGGEGAQIPATGPSGAHVVIATPRRLLSLVSDGGMSLTRVTYFAIDEVDRMLDLGFSCDVRRISAFVRPDRQALVFSAAWNKEVETLALALCPERPVRICASRVVGGELNGGMVAACGSAAAQQLSASFGQVACGKGGTAVTAGGEASIKGGGAGVGDDAGGKGGDAAKEQKAAPQPGSWVSLGSGNGGAGAAKWKQKGPAGNWSASGSGGGSSKWWKDTGKPSGGWKKASGSGEGSEWWKKDAEAKQGSWSAPSGGSSSSSSSGKGEDCGGGNGGAARWWRKQDDAPKAHEAPQQAAPQSGLSAGTSAGHIVQEVMVIDQPGGDWEKAAAEKRKLLERHVTNVLTQDWHSKMLICVNTRRDAEDISNQLSSSGHKADCVHGRVHQDARLQAVEQLRKGKIRVLVATDAIGPGVETPGVTHVVIFDYMGYSIEDYQHRVDRAGAGGNEGHLLTFFEFESDSPGSAAELIGVLERGGHPVPSELRRVAAEAGTAHARPAA